MSRTVPLVLIAAVFVLAAPAARAQSAPAENDDTRYTFNRADDGYLRLDGRTGQVSICARRTVGWACQAVPDERTALEAEIARLQAENVTLKKELVARNLPLPGTVKPEQPAPKAEEPKVQLPSDADLNKVMNFMEKVWRRLVEMIVSLQKDILNKTYDAEPWNGYMPVLSGQLSAITAVAPEVIATATLSVETGGQGFTEITREARRFIAQAGAKNGMLLLFIRHTSASLVIQENADPDVRTDFATALDRLAPTDAGWVHDVEGPDDMPAHVKTMLTDVSLLIPVIEGALALGIWQGIYVAEHRAQPHRREIVLQFVGSTR